MPAVQTVAVITLSVIVLAVVASFFVFNFQVGFLMERPCQSSQECIGPGECECIMGRCKLCDGLCTEEHECWPYGSKQDAIEEIIDNNLVREYEVD